MNDSALSHVYYLLNILSIRYETIVSLVVINLQLFHFHLIHNIENLNILL